MDAARSQEVNRTDEPHSGSGRRTSVAAIANRRRLGRCPVDARAGKR